MTYQERKAVKLEKERLLKEIIEDTIEEMKREKQLKESKGE